MCSSVECGQASLRQVKAEAMLDAMLNAMLDSLPDAMLLQAAAR